MASPLLFSNLGIAETARLATYLKSSFLAQRNQNSMPGTAGMDIDDVLACDWSASLLAEATRNIVRTTWSIEDYRDYLKKKSPCSTGRNTTFEAKLLLKFPPIYEKQQRLSKPSLVLDKDGNILVCYLPRLIKREYRLPMWQSVATMESHMDIRQSSASWRNDAANYLPPSRCRISPGTFSIAPFWYQQAHSTVAKLEVSAKMRTLDGQSWVSSIRKASSLLGALLSVVHPSQYRAGVGCINQVAENPQLVDKSEDLGTALQLWTAPFTGISVMNNRRTPVHRDNGGLHETMDLLASVGPYTKASMTLPTLGLELDYPTGTVMLLIGRLIAHKAEADGERAVLSYYLKETVVNALTEESIDFPNLRDLM